MDFTFTIPLSRDDLMHGDGEKYVVQEIYSVRTLSGRLDACFAEFKYDGPTAVLKEFDVLYSIIRRFNEVDADIRERAWGTLISAVSQHVSELSIILDPEGIDYQVQKTHLCALKMESYLLSQFSEAFEAEATKPSIDTEVGKKKRGKQSKRITPIAKWDWDLQRERALDLAMQILKLDINRLWEPPIVEEEFINLFTSLCYKFLENTAAVKLKDTKETMFNILGISIKKYNHSLGACLKIIQLLQHFEHLVPHLCQAVTIFVTEYGAKNFVSEVIREIGRMDSADLSRDTSGTRSFSQFIVELAEKLPSLVLPNISFLLTHLDGDNYAMRNGVLGVIGELVLKVLSKDDLDTSMKNTRDTFLDRLEENLHDVHAFVRSKVIQIWLNLCNEKAIPLNRHGNLLNLVIGRLDDKSCQVRKYAIQFLKAFLCRNPFSARLPLEHLKGKLEQETQKLRTMLPELNEELQQEVQQGNDKWIDLEPDLRKVVEELSDKSSIELSEDPDLDLNAESDVESAMEYICTSLSKGDLQTAVAILKNVMQMFPNHKICCLITEDEDIFLGEEESNSQDEENVNKNADRNGRVEREMAALEDIFKNRNLSTNNDVTLVDEIEKAARISEEIHEPTPEIEVNEITKQQILVEFLKDSVQFATQMQRVIPVLCQLLGSKTNTDILETIQFFISAHEFGLNNVDEGIRRMLALVWSRDQTVKEAIVNAYKSLYIEPSTDNQRNTSLSIVQNLTKLTMGATLGQLTSLEELLKEFMKAQLIHPSVIQLLWQRFAMKVPQTTTEESRAALLLLGMFAGAESSIVKSNIDVLIENGLGPRGHDDFVLAMNTCYTLLKLNSISKKPGVSDDDPFRLPEEHSIFEKLEIILVRGLLKSEASSWIPLAQHAVNVIYQLAEHPDKLSGRLLVALVRALVNINDVPETEEKEPNQTEANCDSSTSEALQEPKSPLSNEALQEPTSSNFNCQPKILARLIAVAGHVAFKQLHHLDVSTFSELKRRHRIQQLVQEKKKENQKGGKRLTRTSHCRSASSLITPAKPQDSTTGQDTAIEDELGVGGAAAEDAEAEFIRKICEHDIVTGSNLLALFGPLVVNIASNPNKYDNEELKASTALALSKFMLVSSEFCETNLQLLFTILEKSKQSAIRANTIIALGDLTFRFPNLIEPWTSNLYARLRDESVEVRQTAVTVLTHLILNDMVKVKGQISEMAVCLEDTDKRISDLTKLFFAELARKSNALYNILPDIISRLSDPDTGIQENKYRTIMEYLFPFIQKDKQAESLVEKLCHRFRATRTERQWRDLAFCLSLLSYNERCLRKLQENFACFQTQLSNEDVYTCFSTVISKSKKFMKQEVKVLIDELEKQLTECHTKGAEDEADFNRAAKASEHASKKSVKSRRKTSSRNKRRSDENESDENNENQTPAPVTRRTRNATKSTAGKSTVRAKRTQRGKKNLPPLQPLQFSSDEDFQK